MDNIVYKNKQEVYSIVDTWAKENRFDFVKNNTSEGEKR